MADESRANALFARYVEHLVVEGIRLPVEELASGEPGLTAALRARIDAFQKIEAALTRNREVMTGRTLGRYRVFESLGAGGMGEVYRAADTELRREVAIKILPKAFALEPQRRARFEREARLLAALNHPHIESIYGVEKSDGLPFMVLELVAGETLAERIARGPLPPAEALPLFREIALSLEAAHAKGIVHRDLKPANIKITPERHAKVLDFGLGKALAGDGGHLQSRSPLLSQAYTVTGMILGTAAYMSPEQARGQEVDLRTDVWSYGCVLYESLVGRAAFKGETFSDIVAAVVGQDPDWKALPKATPAALRRLLRRCLEKAPDCRPRGLAEARAVIEEALGMPSRVRRRRRLLATAVTAAGTAMAVAVLTPVDRHRSQELPPGIVAASPPPVAGAALDVSLESYRARLGAVHAQWRERLDRERGSARTESLIAYVVTEQPATMQLLDTRSYRLFDTRSLPVTSATDELFDAVLAPDGERLYVTDRTADAVLVVDTTSRTSVTVRGGGAIPAGNLPDHMALTPDGRRAYVTNMSGSVSVIDTDPTSSAFHTVLPVPDGDAIRLGGRPRGIVLTPDGRRAYVANDRSDTVSVIDTDPASPKFHTVLSVPDGGAIRVGREPHGVAVSPDARLLYVPEGRSETVSAIDIDPSSPTFHTVVRRTPVAVDNKRVFPFHLALTPDGSRAYVSCRESGQLLVIDTSSGDIILPRLDVGSAPGHIIFTPEGDRALVGSRWQITVVDTDPTSSTFHRILTTIPLRATFVAVRTKESRGRAH